MYSSQRGYVVQQEVDAFLSNLNYQYSMLLQRESELQMEIEQFSKEQEKKMKKNEKLREDLKEKRGKLEQLEKQLRIMEEEENPTLPKEYRRITEDDRNIYETRDVPLKNLKDTRDRGKVSIFFL
jgi:septation ring formation regulator EzrA